MPEEVRVPILSDADIVTARQKARALAAKMRFTTGDLTLLATAVSEVARNIVSYAKTGEVILSVVEKGGRRGVTVVARDEGPGIPNVDLALTDGYSTGRSLGMGLPGARRLMDEFAIESQVGKGTTVTMTKWERRA
jgi:serine/threonine-protein kinase RsbT